MNKEYLYFSDKELLVIDENGHATKRNIENTNMHDMLLLENDLEKINETIIKLEKKIRQDKESKLTKKEKIFLAMIPFIIVMSAFGIVCLFVDLPISIAIDVAWAIAVLEVSFTAITKYYHTRDINGTKNELSTAYQLRENLEQKLNKILSESKDYITPNIVDPQKSETKINDVIILEESTPFYEEARKQLYESYTTGYKQKVKRLGLKH